MLEFNSWSRNLSDGRLRVHIANLPSDCLRNVCIQNTEVRGVLVGETNYITGQNPAVLHR